MNLIHLANEKFENEFDLALVVDERDRTFIFSCNAEKNDNYYVSLTPAKQTGEDYLVFSGNRVWDCTFFAAEPKYKRGMLSNMLECLQTEPSLDRPFNLHQHFGGKIYGRKSRRQA
mgnify:FL=1